MKNIHVILICYPHSSCLNQTIASLQFISHRLEGITVLGEKEDAAFGGFHPSYQIKYIKVTENNLGKRLDSFIHTISSEYILILQDGMCINSKISRLKLGLEENQNIITFSHSIKDKTLLHPFLIRTSYIKKHKFLSSYSFPFSEALMPAWVASIQHTGMVIHKGDFVSSKKIQGTGSALPIIEFIEKYQKKFPFVEKTPSISVILAHFNMEQYVGTAISSCLLQIFQADQVLIIDDGSTNHSYKELEKWSAHSGVEIFRKENGGKARALNELLPHIQTDFVLELDADDWLDPDALSIIRKHLLNLSEDVIVLYGNLRTWKQRGPGSLQYKGIRKGHPVSSKRELTSYQFPLGPRIYRSTALKTNGFPVIEFEDGRMYEDVSVLNNLLKRGRLVYNDFTVYNVREHPSSITKRNRSNWNDFLKFLD
ncbi:glycosyltransferase family 2 protein [Mesobacillus foraminis]|uniref:Glycosyl transferase family 2 n=1 Tax=Mesobacillus foraminis TaxID=279826 RepID=A0A4R2BLA6_9BACI|nr:glycosyltransferase family A protein [Mesobacillus foraminis]TCN27846.1 glycosyl transferase family 2 [Mesobacillus foraminis]